MLVIITGGSGSGKSAFAEKMMDAVTGEQKVYIATMFPFGEETQKKIERHRQMRKDKHFDTLECFYGLKQVKLQERVPVLLECMSNLVANELYMEEGAGKDTVAQIMQGVAHIEEQTDFFCIISNEVFADGIAYDESTKEYMQMLGTINQQLVKRADICIEIVYGIPLVKKLTERGAKTYETIVGRM